MRKITIYIILAFLLAFCATPAYAVPALPHAFFGSVTINGSAASDGSQVSATVDTGTVIPTQNPVTTSGGNYGIDSLRLLVQGNITPGANITFYVDGYEATPSEAASFESGGGPDRIDLSVTIAAPTPPPTPEPEPEPAGGGGGGGGGAAALPTLPAGTTDVRGMIGTGCRFDTFATAVSDDELCTLTIPANTVGLTKELECLTEITMLTMDEPPPPPEAAYVIGLIYDFQPSGATFDPPITLTFSYDPADIPDGIAEEDLVIAYYDEVAGEWVELEGCVVDTENNTITATVSHFTAFATVGAAPPLLPAPAAFSVTGLSIQPVGVEPNEPVTITVSVANTGGTEDSYSVVLKINGVKEAEKSVTVAAGSSEDVSFSVTREEVDSYSVTVDGLSDSFVVVAAPLPLPVPAPAPPPAKPINWPLIGGIIGGVIVVGLGIFFLVRRRAY